MDRKSLVPVPVEFTGCVGLQAIEGGHYGLYCMSLEFPDIADIPAGQTAAAKAQAGFLEATQKDLLLASRLFWQSIQ